MIPLAASFPLSSQNVVVSVQPAADETARALVLSAAASGAGRPLSLGSCRTATFYYNALGQLVETNSTSPSYRQEFVYDASGASLGSYNGAGNLWFNQNILLGGRMIANYDNADTRFVHYNHLTSTTMVSKQDGTVSDDELFYPWGQRWTNAGTTGDLHFATMVGDQELWYTPARRYDPSAARYLSPDPSVNFSKAVANPQRWNRYQ